MCSLTCNRSRQDCATEIVARLELGTKSGDVEYYIKSYMVHLDIHIHRMVTWYTCPSSSHLVHCSLGQVT
jgi:hypothetical protein